tara:strand:+ start:313 stop:1536 length:1224 start_codon:yes stop_codon:yes gene_type:complete
MSKELYKVLKKERKRGGEIRTVGANTLRKLEEEGRSLTKEQIEVVSKSDKRNEMLQQLENLDKMDEEQREITIRNVLDEVNDKDIDKKDPSRQAITTANRAETAGFVAAGLVVLGAATEAASPYIDMATPVLAISGVGLPLAAGLLLLSTAAKTLKGNLILNNLIMDCELVLKKTANMHKLMMTALSIFNDVINERDYGEIVANRNLDVIEIPKQKTFNKKRFTNSVKKEFGEITFEPRFLEKLKIKMEYFNSKLTDLVPDVNSSMFKKFQRGMKRTTASGKYIEIIQRELTLLNSYFIIYNNQFEWILRRYEKILLRTEHEEILNDIWFFIEESKEYKNYLHNPSLLEEIKEIDDEERDAVIKKAEEAKVLAKLDKEAKNNLNGGKRKNKTKRIRRKIKNKTNKKT